MNEREHPAAERAWSGATGTPDGDDSGWIAFDGPLKSLPWGRNTCTVTGLRLLATHGDVTDIPVLVAGLDRLDAARTTGAVTTNWSAAWPASAALQPRLRCPACGSARTPMNGPPTCERWPRSTWPVHSARSSKGCGTARPTSGYWPCSERRWTTGSANGCNTFAMTPLRRLRFVPRPWIDSFGTR